MKKIIVFSISIAALSAFLSISYNNEEYRFGQPVFAVCTSDNIINNCCGTFFKVLQSETVGRNQKTREQKAVSLFGRCLRGDMGCSVETTELKTKSVNQIRQLCQ